MWILDLDTHSRIGGLSPECSESAPWTRLYLPSSFENISGKGVPHLGRTGYKLCGQTPGERVSVTTSVWYTTSTRPSTASKEEGMKVVGEASPPVPPYQLWRTK